MPALSKDNALFRTVGRVLTGSNDFAEEHPVILKVISTGLAASAVAACMTGPGIGLAAAGATMFLGRVCYQIDMETTYPRAMLKNYKEYHDAHNRLTVTATALLVGFGLAWGATAYHSRDVPLYSEIQSGLAKQITETGAPATAEITLGKRFVASWGATRTKKYTADPICHDEDTAIIAMAGSILPFAIEKDADGKKSFRSLNMTKEADRKAAVCTPK